MKKHTWVRSFAIAGGLWLSVAPTVHKVGAAEPGSPVAAVPSNNHQPQAFSRDIVLSPEGRLEGVLLDRQGTAQAGLPVMLLQNGVEVAGTTTDESGRFAISGLRGGQYALATIDSVTPCRLWSATAAPPSAKPTLHVYSGDLIRGQMFRVRNFVTSPIFVGAAVGTAVAVPLALHNREPSS